MEEIGKILKRYRRAAHLTQKNVADALGVNRVSVTQWENGSAKPNIERLGELAKLFGVPTDALLTGTPLNTVIPTANIKNDVIPANVELPSRQYMPQDVPVMGTAACNADHGSFKLDASIIDYVRRPPGLLTTKDVYALYVEGDSMEPRFTAGDLVFVHPRKPVRIGDSVVVQIAKSENEPIEAMIAVLSKRTSHEVFLQKYNPNQIIHFDNKNIVAIHKILEMAELFGL
ncbi:XRE family transcriptional regulator [uncultured Bartonella sp.]|uniref:XRE family transcriptional regulator n=1 Tax=uncultured Bartonella sp. TaxID=104108 RepID=UPI0025FFB30A|nr:XRE family transcriptional regulator [uncultured Bartonella sp.]